MAPKRLSATEKQEIAERYRQPGESTSTLARAFGVSTSTIGRLLKASFDPEEYETLVQQKRSLGRGGGSKTSAKRSEPPAPSKQQKPKKAELAEPSDAADRAPSDESDSKTSSDKPKRKTRTRSRTKKQSVAEVAEATQTETPDSDAAAKSTEAPIVVAVKSGGATAASENGRTSRRRRRRSNTRRSLSAPEESNAGAVSSEREREAAATAESDESSSEASSGSRRRRSRRSSSRSRQETPDRKTLDTQAREDAASAAPEPDSDFEAELPSEQPADRSVVSLAAPPLSEASLPKICYLVVDRSSELIARPLQEFGELGEIPNGEEREPTLPVFDNHRVARRFANRTQRVMKIPDSRVLQKTGSHLQAKGITRLLIDGKVYAL